MSEPICAQKEPYAVEVEAGKAYFWCACGRSETQPFCDGKHSGTGISPVRFKPEEQATVYFCGCKATGDSPMCDGSHNSL
jgi:CDGSH-type Zn-finger protein